jgi:hypothetical protein
MTVQLAIFIVLVFTTFFNNGIQAYIHYEAYPLLAFVGPAEFPAYLKEYERRLTIPLIVPYALAVLSNLILLFTRPATLSVGWLIVTFVLNLAVAVVTMTLATPIYDRIKQAGQVNQEGLGELMRINLLRLGLSTLSSLVIIYLLGSLLALSPA